MGGRRILQGCAVMATAGLLAVASLFLFLTLEHRSDVTLPAPTGQFVVGRSIEVWADSAPDTLAPVPGTKRELLVWTWYPAAPGQSAAVDDYVPAELRRPADRPRGLLIFRLLTRDLSRVHARSIRDPAVAPQQRSYPVVIMRAGASREVLTYSTLAEDLASHGYVVVGFDAPYRTGEVVFPDGRVFSRTPENNPELVFGAPDSARRINRIMAGWTGDIAFVLDRLERLNASDASGKLTGRLDMTRVGVFGHSLGGVAAAQFCSKDARCKAGVDVDGAPLGDVIRDGIPRPFMFLLSDHGEASDPTSRRIMADIQSIYDRLPASGRLRVEIRGANHFTFSDDGALLKSGVVRGILRVFGKLDIDGRRQLALTAYCLRTFFDAYLKGPGTSPPAIAAPQYPEIDVF